MLFITKDDDTQITTTISRETIPSRYRRRLPSNGMEWPVSVIHSAVGFVGGEFEWGKVDKTTKKKRQLCWSNPADWPSTADQSMGYLGIAISQAIQRLS